MNPPTEQEQIDALRRELCRMRLVYGAGLIIVILMLAASVPFLTPHFFAGSARAHSRFHQNAPVHSVPAAMATSTVTASTTLKK